MTKKKNRMRVSGGFIDVRFTISYYERYNLFNYLKKLNLPQIYVLNQTYVEISYARTKIKGISNRNIIAAKTIINVRFFGNICEFKKVVNEICDFISNRCVFKGDFVLEKCNLFANYSKNHKIVRAIIINFIKKISLNYKNIYSVSADGRIDRLIENKTNKTLKNTIYDINGREINREKKESRKIINRVKTLYKKIKQIFN